MIAIALPSKLLLPTIAVVVLFGAFLLAKIILSRNTGSPTGYQSRGSLLTPAELSFFAVLQMALDSQHRIFAKVRRADLIEPQQKTDRRAVQSAFNRIAAKHADFIVCRQSDLAILGVVELDDQSHARADRQARDRFVEQALQSAGIPLLRIKAARTYDRADLAKQLNAMLRLEATTAISK